MPLEQVNIGTAENDPNADTLRAAFAKVNALVAATNQAQSDLGALGAALDGKAPASHTHTYSEITGKPSVFPPAAHSHPWSDLTGVPTAFPPSAHQHTIGDVSGLQTALDAKLDDSQATPTGLAVLGAVNQAAARDALGAPRKQIDVFDTAGTFTC